MNFNLKRIQYGIQAHLPYFINESAFDNHVLYSSKALENATQQCLRDLGILMKQH